MTNHTCPTCGTARLECEWCGNEFYTPRPDRARFCSGRCRQRNHNHLKNNPLKEHSR